MTFGSADSGRRYPPALFRGVIPPALFPGAIQERNFQRCAAALLRSVIPPRYTRSRNGVKSVSRSYQSSSSARFRNATTR
ncbi:hypothetical protein OJJOAM_001260 [Cupriavidus sp. H18C1]